MYMVMGILGVLHLQTHPLLSLSSCLGILLQLNIPIYVINIPHTFPESRPLGLGSGGQNSVCVCVYQCEQSADNCVQYQ